jgi:hypothetical protein
MPPGARLARAFPGKEKKSPSPAMRTGKPWLARSGRPLAMVTLIEDWHSGDGLCSPLLQRRPPCWPEDAAAIVARAFAGVSREAAVELRK